MDHELEQFKTSIPLPAYASSLGFVIEKRKSSARSIVMRHPNGTKIIITRQPDHHYTYWNVHDDGDKGSIIDLVKHHKRLNLGGIRKELRPWLAGGAVNVVPNQSEMSTITKDRAAVRERFASMRVAHCHAYLQERGIPALALQYWRFDGKVKVDRRLNAVFPHYDSDGLCGYELRNRNFKGFASGGAKGLWLSKTIPEDRRLVISESAIDAISYALLNPDGRTRYASIGGKPSLTQMELLKVEIKRMPEGAEIVAAMDNDDAGRQLVALVAKAFEEVRRYKQTFKEHMPAEHKDWNEALQAAKRPFPVWSSQMEVQPA